MATKNRYWQQVLQEVLNKERSEYCFLYTNVGPRDRGESSHGNFLMEEKRRGVILEGEFSGVCLTPREFDCLQVLGEGKTIKEIARDMELSPRTVEFYLKNLKSKFGCKSKTELLAVVASSDLF